MHIVTDSGMDMFLPESELPRQTIHVVRHAVTLNGRTYLSGLDLQATELYQMLARNGGFPTTSQPSVGDFAEVFRKLAASDRQIICINMSSGLSGTADSARAAAALVPEAEVTVIDSKTLSGVLGWQVAAAAHAASAGWPAARIVDLVDQIVAVSDSVFTLNDLTYLVHGGRISHMKGLIASVLKLRPMIGVAKGSGAYEQLGQERTFAGALKGLVDIVQRKHPPQTALRVQIVHAANPEGATMLRNHMAERFRCTFLPDATISPVLGAHTGPTLVGVGFAAQADYPSIP